jgi:hypothetical protein
MAEEAEMKLILGTVLLVVLVLAAYILTRPDRFHIERTATINAPSATIFPHIDDFHRWIGWSPWEEIDPQMQRSYDGPASGAGAGYRWAGNSKIGEGAMKITESTPSSRVRIALEFIKPFRASNEATFTLAPAGTGTQVTWAMDGQNSLMSKTIGLFMSMDTMIGTQFEKGLASLKRIAESETR